MKTSWRYKLANLKMAIGLGASIDEIAVYQYKFPKSVSVEIKYWKEDKVYSAVIKKINGKSIGDGFATQGRNEKELIEMINDAVLTYLDFPPDVSVRLRRVIKPFRLAL
jgi:hypothetical protein